MDTSPGVILFAGCSPDSPSSGYQTLSPCSFSRPSSPEESSSSSSSSSCDPSSLHHRPTGRHHVPSSAPPSFPKPSLHLPEVISLPVSSPLLLNRKPCAPFTNAGGMVILCKVCGDVASGLHYGVHACEGCKGFFRRSIQQNISYKMCVKNESCLIVRMNRNRCQHCRFKKCLSVGMAKNAVRFGRIPKREKARLLDKMQNYIKATTPTEALPTPTSPTPRDHEEVHKETKSNATLSQDFQFHSVSHTTPQSCPSASPPRPSLDRLAPPSPGNPLPPLSHCPASSGFPGTDPGLEASCFQRLMAGAKILACPLNWCPVSPPDVSSQQVWELFSQSFGPAIRDVVEFSRSVPGFHSINQHDQIQLLKSGAFQVLMVRCCTLCDVERRTLRFMNGLSYPLWYLKALGTGNLLDAVFDFSQRFSALKLEPDELALFSAIVLLSSDRTGIFNLAAVEKLREELIDSLRRLLTQRRPNDRQIFLKLLLRLPDLQTLNRLHAEKLLAFSIKP